MQNPLFQGTATAIITPFHNGEVDYVSLANIVEYQIENGIQMIIACGTTGEPVTLTAQEKAKVIQTVVTQANGRIPVYCGTGTNNTKAVVEAEKQYRDLGCAGQLVVTPYYNKTTQEGLYQHFMYIAEHTTLPIMLYNVPSRTSLEIMPETLRRLRSCEKIVALKESSYNIPLIMEKISAMGDDITLYSGNDDMVYPLLSLGAKGVVSVMSNAIPKLVSDMTTAYFAGDTKKALAEQLRVMPFVHALFAEVNPIPCKHAMAHLGLCTGELRLPLVSASDNVKASIEKELAALRS